MTHCSVLCYESALGKLVLTYYCYTKWFLSVQVILQCFYIKMYLAIVRYGNALFTNNDSICFELHKILSLYKV